MDIKPTVKYHYYADIWSPSNTYRLAILERKSYNGKPPTSSPELVYLGAFTTKQETDLLMKLLPKEWESDTRLAEGYIGKDDTIISFRTPAGFNNYMTFRASESDNSLDKRKCDWLRPVSEYTDSLYPHLKDII